MTMPLPDGPTGTDGAAEGGGARATPSTRPSGPLAGIVEPERLRFDAPPELPLLQAMEQAGIEWPSSCRNGTCRTCIGRVLEGGIRHLIEWPGLSVDEKHNGCVLPCVAVATSDLRIARGSD